MYESDGLALDPNPYNEYEYLIDAVAQWLGFTSGTIYLAAYEIEGKIEHALEQALGQKE